MSQDENKIKKINDSSNIRFVDSKNAKSILSSSLMKAEKKDINTLLDAVNKLDEIDSFQDTSPVPVIEPEEDEIVINAPEQEEATPVEETKEEKEVQPNPFIIIERPAKENNNTLNEQTEEIEVLDESFLNEDIPDDAMQQFLAANNYQAPEEVKEVPQTLEEEFAQPKENIFKKLINRIPTKNRLPIACVLIILFIIGGIFFVRHEIKTHTYEIILKGDETIVLYEGGLYKENGALVFNYKKENKTNLLKVKAKVDTDKVGDYYVTYSVNSIWKKNVITRKVTVLKNPLDDIYFSLNGDDVISLKINTKFNDPGFNIRSDDNVDYSKYVTITSNLNNKKLGTYEIKYLFKINKKQQELVRKVNVVGDRYTVDYYRYATRDNLDVKIISNINNFSFFIVDGKKIESDTITYTVTNNGRYVFEMYDTNGRKEDVTFTVNNIDRTAPTGTCSALMSSSNNTTTFNLNIKDDGIIKDYTYNNLSYTNPTFVVDRIVKSGSVIVSDMAGNTSNINCSYNYDQIRPSSYNNVVMRFNGSTLKYWIEKPTGTYIITHIWVEDPYNQFKVGMPKKFPQLEKANKIMAIANEKYGYYSKAMIGANASGFVSNTFNIAIAKKYPKWKYSSKSPLVIIDGKVLRDYTNLKQVGGAGTLTYGIKSNGYFSSYYVNSPTDMAGNKKNAQLAISDGVKYTFAFGPYLVRSGKLNTGLSAIPDIRQAIGQIDKNNFVIVSNTVGVNNRISGLSLRTLGNIMYKLGCREAYNLDGGGSTNLMYKNRNTNTINSIIYKNRDVADVLFFVEK